MSTPEHISRQRRWQLKQQAAGRCTNCGAERYPQSKTYCLRCLRQVRENSRRRNGHRPWRRGSHGRPPLEVGRRRAGRDRGGN